MYSALAVTAIVLSIALILPSELIQTADAAKASGVKVKQFGQGTKHKVCGDRLCTPADLTKEVKKDLPQITQESVSLQTMKIKMERLFELHRNQLVASWDTLSDSEKSQMMNMVDRMYEMMQSMDFREHMEHMSKMDGKYVYKDGKYGMKDRQGAYCTCGPDGCNCPGCACDEAGVCTCGQTGMHAGCNCGPDGCTCGDGQQGCNCGAGCNCGPDGCTCGDGQQGCNCGAGCNCGPDGCTCGDGQHGAYCQAEQGCTCSDDGVCTCGEGCTCAACQ